VSPPSAGVDMSANPAAAGAGGVPELTLDQRAALDGFLDRFYLGFLELFVYSSLWTAAALASMVLFVSHALGLSATPGAHVVAPALTLFVSCLFIYNLDHVIDARVEGIPDERAEAYFKRFSVLCLLVGSAVATGLMVGTAPRAAQWVFGGYVTVGLLYGLPIFPVRRDGQWSWLRLKDIPGFKSWLVGGAVALAVVGLPAGWNELPMDRSLWFTGIFVFVYTSTNAHMFDVRDVEKDRETGVSTLPATISVGGTRLALIALNLVMILLMLYGWTSLDATALTGFGIVQPGSMAHPELVACAAVTVLYVLLMRPDTRREYYAIFVDGCLFVPWLLALIHHIGS
jgi:4-hydroxybenzoate polyprenyltransferase